MLQRDGGLNAIQGFAPNRIVTVTLSVAWAPTAGMSVFCVPDDCTYKINGVNLSGTLRAGDIRVIIPDQTYTFDTTMDIEVG